MSTNNIDVKIFASQHLVDEKGNEVGSYKSRCLYQSSFVLRLGGMGEGKEQGDAPVDGKGSQAPFTG